MDQFDHHSKAFADHWREQYGELRARCPVEHTDSHDGFYVVTTYDLVEKVLHDPATFVCGRDLDLGTGRPVPGGVTVPTNAFRMGMMEMDPPRSQALRKIVAARFTAKAVKEYTPRLEELVGWCLDRVTETGSIDFVDDLANPLPALVTLDYLGLPLTNWRFYATTLHKAAYREKGSARAVALMLEDLHAIVKARQERAPVAHDVVDLIVHGHEGDRPLNEDLAVEYIFMLLNGGVDTTTALIANTFLYLHDNPGARHWLSEDPRRIPAAVDELIRYTSPSTGVARTVAEPVELAGVQLHPGDRVYLALGSANADGDTFPAADQVRLDRDKNRHLSFGSGIHRCLGAFVAPAEMTILIREVLARMPDFVIDRDRVLAYPTIPLVNGYIAMPATFSPGPRVTAEFLDDELPTRRTQVQQSS